MNPIPSYHLRLPNGELDYSKRNPEAKAFSEYFKSCFFNGNPIKFDENPLINSDYNGYVKELYWEIEKDFNLKRDWERTNTLYRFFKASYSVKLRWMVYEYFVDFLIEKDELERALQEWDILQEEEWAGFDISWTFRNSAIDRLVYFQRILKRPVVDARYLYRMAPKDNQLTKFGKDNIEYVFLTINEILYQQYEGNFIAAFYHNYSFDNSKLISLPANHYLNFFQKNKKFQYHYNNICNSSTDYIKKDGTLKKDIVYLAMRAEAGNLLRDGENAYRLKIGGKKIGESWISETDLFHKVKLAFPDLEIIHHGSPTWLGRQHFDIWFPKYNIAIEYQGEQHLKPIDFFGGKKAFERNLERDNLKKEKCKMNNCHLIEVFQDYDIEQVLTQIKNQIKLRRVN